MRRVFPKGENLIESDRLCKLPDQITARFSHPSPLLKTLTNTDRDADRAVLSANG
jgi:hypothetical protein